MFKGIPNSESAEVSKGAVIMSLRQNSEDLSLLNKFLDVRESEVQSSKEALILNIEIAEIYRDAGLVDAAYEAFLDARDQAIQEGDNDLANELDAEAVKLMLE